MMFDKEAQRRRAQEIESRLKAEGKVAPVISTPVVVSAPKGAWPFGLAGSPAAHTPQAPQWPHPNPPTSKPVKAPKVAKVNYLEIPFTNELGQTIQPGQEVIAVTSGYSHAIKINKATFLGVRKDDRDRVTTVVVHGAVRNYRSTGTPKRRSLPGRRIYPTI
jgi:hypothetical protein